MTLNPQLNQSVDNANQLIKQKEQIESQIQEYEAILRSHKVGMKTPLVDSDGFPRADIDVYAVRTARSHLASTATLI